MTQEQLVFIGAADRSREGSAWFMLVLFTVIHIVLNIDRAVLSILAEPIKTELGLTDTQIGILAGIGFSAFYSVAGILLGWAVDRWNRHYILVACVTVFAASTTAAAMTTSFAGLLIARMLVGVGEAGGGPAMVSMLMDRLPSERRGWAMGIFYTGVPLGFLSIFLLGAVVAFSYGWRSTFLAAGIPGLLLAILALVAIRETPNRHRKSGSMKSLPAIRQLFGQPSFRYIFVATACHSAAFYAIVSFSASFFIRSHDLSLKQIGLMLAAAIGVAGLAGSLIGGPVADRLAQRGLHWRPLYCGIVLTVSFAAASGSFLWPMTAGALALTGLWGFSANLYSGPAMASLHCVVPQHARGTATAVYYLAGNLLGTGGGALAAGLVSDALKPVFGAASLGHALVLVQLFEAVAAVCWFLAAQRFTRDSARVQDSPQATPCAPG
jgi:predicted MFS family arabinose efflux permease